MDDKKKKKKVKKKNHYLYNPDDKFLVYLVAFKKVYFIFLSTLDIIIKRNHNNYRM